MAKIEGGMGAVPPPHAPREVAQPLSEELLAEQMARARANEKSLEPLTYSGIKPVDVPLQKANRREPPPVPDPPAQVEIPVEASSLVDEFFDAPVEPSSPALDAAQPYQPAASNSDSPARGVPRPIDDPGKAITGGFGDVGEAQYFPLDGTELRSLVLILMDELVQRLENDLRFSVAVTYPRVTARIEVHVEGIAEDQGFVIPMTAPPHEKTPVEVARQYGREVVFILTADRREMTPEGESVTPPNKMRLEMGLTVPRKQRIEVPGGFTMVDVPTS